jgi:hypothetical protein
MNILGQEIEHKYTNQYCFPILDLFDSNLKILQNLYNNQFKNETLKYDVPNLLMKLVFLTKDNPEYNSYIKQIIETHNIDINHKNKFGITALHISIYYTCTTSPYRSAPMSLFCLQKN